MRHLLILILLLAVATAPAVTIEPAPGTISSGQALAYYPTYARDCRLTSDGSQMVILFYRLARWVDLETQTVVRDRELPADAYFTRDKIVVRDNERIVVLDFNTGEISREFDGPVPVFDGSPAISEDGSLLACQISDHIVLVNLLDGNQKSFDYESRYGRPLYLLNNGAHILYSGFYSTRLVDTATGQETILYNNTAVGVKGVAATPDGQWAVTSHGDGFLRLWDLGRRIEEKRIKVLSQGLIFQCAISSNGRYVAVYAKEIQGVEVYDMETGLFVYSKPCEINFQLTDEGELLFVTESAVALHDPVLDYTRSVELPYLLNTSSKGSSPRGVLKIKERYQIRDLLSGTLLEERPETMVLSPGGQAIAWHDGHGSFMSKRIDGDLVNVYPAGPTSLWQVSNDANWVFAGTNSDGLHALSMDTGTSQAITLPARLAAVALSPVDGSLIVGSISDASCIQIFPPPFDHEVMNVREVNKEDTVGIFLHLSSSDSRSICAMLRWRRGTGIIPPGDYVYYDDIWMIDHVEQDETSVLKKRFHRSTFATMDRDLMVSGNALIDAEFGLIKTLPNTDTVYITGSLDAANHLYRTWSNDAIYSLRDVIVPWQVEQQLLEKREYRADPDCNGDGVVDAADHIWARVAPVELPE